MEGYTDWETTQVIAKIVKADLSNGNGGLVVEGGAGRQEVRLDGGALRDLFSAHGKLGALEEGPGLVVCVCVMCVYNVLLMCC